MPKNKYNDREKLRGRWLGFLVYEDSMNLQDIIDVLDSFEFEYCYIKHSPETNETKEHIHFVLHTQFMHSIGWLSAKTNIPSNLIQIIDNSDNAITYLCHLNNDEKIQYDINNVMGSSSLVSRLRELYSKQYIGDSDIYNAIIQIIYSSNGHISFKSLFKTLNDLNYLSYYKKYYVMFRDIISEHNLNTKYFKEEEK